VPTIEHMTIQRMDHVGIVVDDLADAVSHECGVSLICDWCFASI
jgi:hypothetical protein